MAIGYRIKRAARQAAMLAAACFLASAADAFVIRQNGDIETASVLYAVGAGGSPIKVAQVGDKVSGGGIVSEIGKPALGPDGLVVFSAEVRSDSAPSWKIFAEHTAAHAGNLRPILDRNDDSRKCRPILKIDPEVNVSADGSIYFLAPGESGRDSLFRYANNHLSCPVSVGDRTAQGHSIVSIHFGSAKVAKSGAVALKARLLDNKRGCKCSAEHEAILLLAPGHAVSEVALEGNRSPGGGRYSGRFGAPAVAGSQSSVIVSFTDRDSHGNSALFVGPPRQLVRTLATGAVTSAGKLTYISDGPPGMSDAGHIAIRVAVGERSSIVTIRDGEVTIAANEGDPIAGGRKIVGFDDPMFSSSDDLTVEASDETGEAHIMNLPSSSRAGLRTSGVAAVDSGSIPLFPHSLAIDGQGRSAFLAAQTGSISRAQGDEAGADDGSI